MIEVFTAIGIVTVIISGSIAVIGILIIIRDWRRNRRCMAAFGGVVVRKPLGDCTCTPARAPSGFEFRIPHRQCTLHGHEWTA